MNQYLSFRIFVFISCLSGCVYQVYYISSQYFAYQTTTRVESNLQDIVRYPSSVLCTRIKHFLDPVGLSKSNVTSHRDLHQLTITQLHNLTPLANDSISNCLMRLNDYGFFKKYQQKICYEHFIVMKVILGKSVCYHFHPKAELKYSIHRAANAFNFSHIIYELVLTKTFSRISEFYIIGNYPTKADDESAVVRFPVNSRKFGRLIFRSGHETWILQRPQEKIFKLMPAPYDTNCLSNNNYCLRDCYTNITISKLQRFPFTEPADEFSESYGRSSDLQVLSPIDLENPSIASAWPKIQEQCQRKCNKPSCEMSVTFNNAYAYHHPWKSVPLSLTVSLPTSNPIKVTALPEINWIEYTSGICNAISIWFGFSVIAVNPLKYQKRYQQFKQGWKLENLYSKLPLLTYYMFCVLGFLYQSQEICKDYFLYNTGMTIEVMAGDEYPYQGLAICIDFSELLNRTNYAKLGISATASDAMDNWEDEYSALTTRQLFDLTPDVNTMISECGVRGNNTNIGFENYLGEECLKFFSMDKTLKANQVCYYYIPQMALTYLWSKVSSSYNDGRQLFKIETGIFLNRSTLVTVFTFAVDQLGGNYTLPLDSHNFGHEAVLYPETIVPISSATVIFDRLPSPYDTGCLSNYSIGKCLFICSNPELSAFKRSPYFSILTSPGEDKILSFHDVRNDTVRSVALTVLKSCYSQCSGYPCHQVVSFTLSSTYLNQDPEKNLNLISFLPDAPNIKIHYVPAIDPLNFFINIFNSCGIWFGLSIISLDPQDLFRKGNLLFARENHKSPWIRKVLQAIFATACFAGFLWQLHHVASTYFSYGTYSRLQVSTQDIYRFPTINICVQYGDILDSDITSNSSTTVKNIFESTPLENNTVYGCSFRDFKTDQMEIRNRTECLTEFKTTKYIFGAKICYAYSFEEPYSLAEVTSMPTQTGIVYTILLNTIFNKISFFAFYWFTEALNYTTSGRATRSRKYGYGVLRDPASPRALNYFVVQGMNYNITLLPEPYETRCLPNILPRTCFSRCNINYTKTVLDRMPFDEFVLEPVTLKIVSKEDMENSTVSELVNDGYKECNRACLHQPCNQYYSITRALEYWRPNLTHNGIVVAAAVPTSNDLVVHSYPSLTLMDFLNNLAVSGSIWLGVSVMSIAMYPVKLFKKEQEEKLKRRSPNQTFRGFNKEFKVFPRSYCPCLYCQKHFRGQEFVYDKPLVSSLFSPPTLIMLREKTKTPIS